MSSIPDQYDPHGNPISREAYEGILEVAEELIRYGNPQEIEDVQNGLSNIVKSHEK